MTDGPKIVNLEAPQPTRAAVDNLRRILPEMIEHAALLAKIRRASYLALVEEGFTESQALELCAK
jgi:hypothetical protein